MEKKVCTYTAKSVRLQLVSVNGDNDQWYFDIRYNRRTIMRFNDYDALYARHYFSHVVSHLCIDRDLSIVSNMTT